METPIRELNLDKRSENALIRGGYKYIEELVNLSEADLYSIRNVGSQAVERIQTALASYIEKHPTITKSLFNTESSQISLQRFFISDSPFPPQVPHALAQVL